MAELLHPLLNLANAPLRQQEDSVGASLLFQIGLKLIPRSEEFAAVVAYYFCVRLNVFRDAQPDSPAVRTFKFVIKISRLCHQLQPYVHAELPIVGAAFRLRQLAMLGLEGTT